MKKKFLFAVLICIMFALASCGVQETPPPTTKATLSTLDISKVTFSQERVMLSEAKNALGAPFGLNKYLDTAELKGITYAFEPGISAEDRAACIQATEEILSRIGLDKNIQIHIYAESTYDSTFINGSSIFTHLQDWKSPEYVSALLYGLFGEYCNYGAVYGYSNYLCHELYGTPLDVYSGDWTYEGELNALDLNLLCFRSEFVAEEDIQSVRKIANTFVADYIAANGETEFHKLLESSGDTEKANEFADILASFYASKDITHMPSSILYRLGGRGYDYIAKCKYATMYIEKDWYDANKDLSPYTYDGFLHQNYGDTRQFFSINIEQMESYQELFALGPYNNELNIYFSNHQSNTSGYDYGHHSILSWNTGSFTHEYIHSLTYEHMIKEYWAGEGMAEYFSRRFDYYGSAMSSVDYNSLPDTSRYRYVHEYRSKIGRDLDMSKDSSELQHIATYAYGFDSPNDGNGYIPGASFIGYLITRFGEEKVIKIICETHDFGEYTYEELVADWLEFIEENYSEYSKVKS